MNLRVLVVDDSIIFRKVVRDCLAEFPDVEVIDVAKDGQVAMEKIRRLNPDIVTLDLDMPVMDGLEVLEAIEREGIDTNVIMVSSYTKRGAAITTRALEAGAFDFILKPQRSNPEDNRRELQRQLQHRIDLLKQHKPQALTIHADTGNTTAPGNTTTPGNATASNQPTRQDANASRAASIESFGTPNDHETIVEPDAICIGVSTGGPKALGKLIPALSEHLDVPILIVQHMPPMFTGSLAKHLDTHSKLTVVEAEDEMTIAGGMVVIAPGGKQMKVAGYPGAWKIEITNDPPIRGCRPCVDYLFESAAMQFRSRLIGIVMTGMGNDGTIGSAAIAERGGQVWVQDESSSTVYGMPRAVIDSGIDCAQRSMDELIDGINQFGRRKRLATLNNDAGTASQTR